ncbi:MAG: DNA-binding protein [Desulfurivibrionaceae bacterium]
MKSEMKISALVVLIIILMVFSASSWARQGKNFLDSRDLKSGNGQNRVYDTGTVETVSATVAKVEKIRPMPGMSYGVHLSVKTESGETLAVHLGPAWFLKEEEMEIEDGDKLEITGSRVEFERKEAMIAASVKKKGKILKLRDEDGFPLWSGWRRSYRNK